MKLFKGASPKPSSRYAKLAHALRDNGLDVSDNDFETLDDVCDLCNYAAVHSCESVTAELMA